MNGGFPVLAFIWLFLYFLKDSKTLQPSVDALPLRTPLVDDDEKHIQYVSNGRLLAEPHFYYYFDMLDLGDGRKICDSTINKAADERYALINKIDYDHNWPIATRDVNSARAYLLDRWNYMMNLN